MTPDPRRAYQVTDEFEAELCRLTGARHAVAVDSCTNALFLCLRHTLLKRQARGDEHRTLRIPRRTYVGVLQAVVNAGWRPEFTDETWQVRGRYQLGPTRVIDSARRFGADCYEAGTLTCVSFHVAKQLPLGRGGAILLNDAQTDCWLRAARADGRDDAGEVVLIPAWHMFMPPDVAARGLWALSRGYTPGRLEPFDYPRLDEAYARLT